MTQANCFRIEGWRVLTGIPYHQDSERNTVIGEALGLPTRGRPGVLLRGKGLKAGFIERAFPRQTAFCGKWLSEWSNKGEACAIVYFHVPSLSFDGPYVDGINLWPGGEWMEKQPWWEAGLGEEKNPRKWANREQIWILRHDERCVVIDANRGVRVLWLPRSAVFPGPAPKLYKPGAYEFSKYLLARAREATCASKRDRSAFEWAARSMTTLYDAHRTDPRVKKGYDEILRLRDQCWPESINRQ